MRDRRKCTASLSIVNVDEGMKGKRKRGLYRFMGGRWCGSKPKSARDVGRLSQWLVYSSLQTVEDKMSSSSHSCPPAGPRSVRSVCKEVAMEAGQGMATRSSVYTAGQLRCARKAIFNLHVNRVVEKHITRTLCLLR